MKTTHDPVSTFPLGAALALMLAALAGAACGPAPPGAPEDLTRRSGASTNVATSQAVNQVASSTVAAALTPISTAARNRMDQARARLTALGLTTITSQGTINLAGATLSPGTHILRPTCGEPAGNMTAVCTTMTGTLPTTSSPSSASATARSAAPSASASQSAAPSQSATRSATVTRYTDDTLTDVSVIIADKVVFDHATVTLSDAVRELWIIAETIESTDSIVTWLHSRSAPPSISDVDCASKGQSFNPDDVTSASAFDSPNGGDGSSWSTIARAGNPGLRAPDIYVFLKYFSASQSGYEVSVPEFHVAGQNGGAGQRGQCGGDGGDGAKGADAQENLINCKQGPGFGGDGGDGGPSGQGGPGGPGGGGGEVRFQFVDLPHVAVQSDIHDAKGGRGGDGGLGGLPGRGGRGGQEGEPKWPYCLAAPERAGKHGHDGTSNDGGAKGADGDDGHVTWSPIEATDWEAAFTAPYIASAAPAVAAVGDSITFSTLNLTGGARLNVDDEYGTFSSSYTLADLGDGQYRWNATGALSSGKYVVTLTRLSDGRVTESSYRVELLPIIDGVRFAASFDAVFGGPAKLTGKGLRSDARLVVDGVDIGPATISCTTGCTSGRQEIAFTIPIRATNQTFFARDDGATPHTLRLDQPYPLTDPPASTFFLKRQAGLTFRPSVNGYPFSNATLTAAAKVDAGVNPWSSFRETYGGLEIDTYMATVDFSPLVDATYVAWRAFWSPTSASALCTAISSSSLDDYFKGVTGVSGYTTSDVAHNVMIRQGHILGREFLSAMAGETVQGTSFTTSVTVSTLQSFLETGTKTDVGSMPVLIMVPSLSVYLSAISTALTSLSATGVGAALSSIVTALGSSHSLAPYNVVFANPADALPSRIYFYDSNAAGTDGMFMTLNNSGTTFNYALGGYSTAAGWTLGHGTIDFLHADASLPLSPLP